MMDRYLDRLAGRKASAVTGEVILPAKKQRSPLSNPMQSLCY